MLDDPEFSRRLFFPRNEVIPAPSGAEDHVVPVDGATLHLRVHPVRGEARGLVLLFHGNGEVVSDWDRAAPSFAAHGYRFAVIDYRGYGASTGTPHMASVIHDARAAYAYVRRLGNERHIVMGRSLGSAAAWEVASSTPELTGLVIDSGFCDVDAFVRRRGFEPTALPSAERALLDPLPKIARITAPTLLLHGELDTTISIREAERAFEALGTNERQLARIAGRGHNDIGMDRAYWRALGPFLDGLADENQRSIEG